MCARGQISFIPKRPSTTWLARCLWHAHRERDSVEACVGLLLAGGLFCERRRLLRAASVVSRAKPAAFSGNRKLQNPEVRALHTRKTWAVWAGFSSVVEGLFLFLFQKKNSRKRLNTLMRSRTRSTGQWLAEGGLGLCWAPHALCLLSLQTQRTGK